MLSPLRRVARNIRGRRVLGLVAFRDEERFLPGLLENLEGQVDGLVALDDGSTDRSAEIVGGHPLTVELLRVPAGTHEELEDGRLHRALVEAAWSHEPDWLLGLDADERLERDFRRRANRVIRGAENDGFDAVWVHFRELWDDPLSYRCDGIWGEKRKACLFAARRDHSFDDRRVHAFWASYPPKRGDWPQADLNLYHLRMIAAEDRRQRVARYRRIDPEDRWQTIGYDYLLDESGLELRRVDPGREYHPLGR